MQAAERRNAAEEERSRSCKGDAETLRSICRVGLMVVSLCQTAAGVGRHREEREMQDPAAAHCCVVAVAARMGHCLLHSSECEHLAGSCYTTIECHRP